MSINRREFIQQAAVLVAIPAAAAVMPVPAGWSLLPDDRPECLAVTLTWEEGTREMVYFSGCKFTNGQTRNFRLDKGYYYADSEWAYLGDDDEVRQAMSAFITGTGRPMRATHKYISQQEPSQPPFQHGDYFAASNLCYHDHAKDGSPENWAANLEYIIDPNIANTPHALLEQMGMNGITTTSNGITIATAVRKADHDGGELDGDVMFSQSEAQSRAYWT